MKKRIFSSIWIGLIAFFCLSLVNTSLAANDEVNFFVDPYYDLSSQEQVKGSFLHESDMAYYYIDTNYLDQIDDLTRSRIESIIEDLGEEFDDIIYPKLTDLFGDVWNPGIDNDPKITIFFSRLINGIGGYFRGLNELSLNQATRSNEREMIYINTDYIFDSRLNSYVAHEFQHLISYNQKERKHNVVDDVWLNELRSEYAPTYLGYDDQDYLNSNLRIRVEKFKKYPSDPLTEWGGKIHDYSSINLLAQYLTDHYGDDFFRELTRSNKVGIESINIAFERMSIDKTFEDIFADWITACYINDLEKTDIYGYRNSHLKNINVSPTASYELSGNIGIERVALTKDWSPLWYEVVSADNSINQLKLEFAGEAKEGSFRARIIKIDQNENYIVNDWVLDNNEGELTISGFGKEIEKVVILPYLSHQANYQTGSIDYNQFSLIISNQEGVGEIQEENAIEVAVEESNDEQAQTTHFSSLNNGDLVSAMGDYRVYIIKDGYRRHIKSGEIFNFYGHLNWQVIKEISSYELSLYEESSLVRASGDKRVYQIDEEGNKHWLNISGQEFVSSGRKWNAVYVINTTERDFYTETNQILN